MGFEADMMWQTSVPGLMLQGGLTYAETEYGDDLLPDADLALLPGNQMSFAPKWSGNASVTYEWGFGANHIGRFNVGAKYMSRQPGSDLDVQSMRRLRAGECPLGFGSQTGAGWSSCGARTSPRDLQQVGIDAPIQSGSWNAFLARRARMA